MRLIISAVTWDQFLRSGMCQLELVPLAEKYGCAGIEFRPYWRSPIEELPEIKDFLSEYGLICTYASNYFLLSDKEETIRRSLTGLENDLYMAGRMGAGILRLNLAVGPFDKALMQTAWWQKAVKEIIAKAAAQEIILAVENAPNPTSGDASLIFDLVNMFASPWLKVTFDTGNWLPAGWDPFRALDILKAYIGYVHIKDMMDRPDGYVPTYPGGGDLDLIGLVDKLEESGYRGYYALEFPGGQSPAAAVKASLKHLRQDI
jgi:L-ribulose-5-phosphate 3-epimerase